MQIVDARGNPFQGVLDSIGGETLVDSRAAVIALSALNAEVLLDIQGKALVLVDVRAAAFNGTVVFEGTVDGTNYFQLPAYRLDQANYIANVNTAAAVTAQVLLTVSGYRRVRVRCSVYTSGSINIAMRGSTADLLSPNITQSCIAISATGAANAAVTLTIPAPAAGLFNYITGIEITRNATAALAGTATLVVTTTNLPGSLAWSVGNAMNAGETRIDANKDFTNPLKSNTAATATTIVAPAPGAAVLWRLTAYYYAAP